ncbi:putative leucine-rich repeat receptor-like serine/threonine-protein kinase [Senna tora]|uniref:Putative leucine-rich repeat receptor-like serine/threonine-protein kinase n=1 Tax=Senna tora TaxID=362788 RepID=A0A834WH79_9FABA|nr:putative leucine-rich repeat receptor-like serine/threonine-protein kinase [Senna tora]
MINIALLCTNVTSSLRPSMSSVVSMLEDRTVQEVVLDESEVLDEMKKKDGPWTETSTSTSLTDLYPVHLDSSYLGGRN